MNFLKNSIFSRSAGGEDREMEPENDNQMLAVWGSPGSGKTTVAVKLAERLAGQKRDVALVLCDMTAPMLPCICPPGDLEGEHSLGSILAATHVSDSLVRHNCITHKRYGHLTIIGMLKGENEYTYPPHRDVYKRQSQGRPARKVRNYEGYRKENRSDGHGGALHPQRDAGSCGHPTGQ